jgi:hypothetical protein
MTTLTRLPACSAAPPPPPVRRSDNVRDGAAGGQHGAISTAHASHDDDVRDVVAAVPARRFRRKPAGVHRAAPRGTSCSCMLRGRLGTIGFLQRTYQESKWTHTVYTQTCIRECYMLASSLRWTSSRELADTRVWHGAALDARDYARHAKIAPSE